MSKNFTRELCGAYKEFQSQQKGCLLPLNHLGDHQGEPLDLVTDKMIEETSARNREYVQSLHS